MAKVISGPDAYWISPVLPLPPLDPSAVRKGLMQQQQQQVGTVASVANVGQAVNVNMQNMNMQQVGVAVQQAQVGVQGQQQLNMNVGQVPAPLSVRQVSAGSGSISNAVSTVRTASPLSNASSSNEIRSNVNANVNANANANVNINTNTSRTTLIVSGIPTDFATEVVMSAFTTENVVPKSAKPGDAKDMAWYVTFASEQDAQAAIAAAKKANKTINGLPINAKIINVVDLKGSGRSGSNNNSNNSLSGLSGNNSNSNNSSKPSPTTTALPQEGFGETDSGKQTTPPNSRHILQQQPPGQGPVPTPYMGPPPNAAPGAAYQYTPYATLPPGMQPYPPQPNTAVRYSSAHQNHMQPPPPVPLPYPHNFYAHPAAGAHPYQHQQYVPRPPFYAPNQPAHVLFRHATDPGMRHNAKNKGGGGNANTNGDGGSGTGGGNIKKKGGKNKKGHGHGNGQQQYQNSQYQQSFSQQSQQYMDHSHGGVGLGMGHIAGQRSGRGSRESLDSVGGTGSGAMNMNDFNRKGTGKSRHDGGVGQGGPSSRRKSASPMMDDNFDTRSSNRSKKKKSKRRGSGADWDRRKDQQQQQIHNNNNNKTEIFDENMFPALSPSKSKPKSSGDVVGGAGPPVPPNNSFSGYADALRQKKNNKPSQEDARSNSGEDTQVNSMTAALEESVAALKISDNGDDVTAKSVTNDDPSPDTINSAAPVESDTATSKSVASEAYDKQKKTAAEPNGTSPEVYEQKPILSNNEPTPKEASEIDVKPVKLTEAASVTKENTNPIEKESNTSKATADPETELNSAPTGAWGAKRSFIDVSYYSILPLLVIFLKTFYSFLFLVQHTLTQVVKRQS